MGAQYGLVWNECWSRPGDLADDHQRREREIGRYWLKKSALGLNRSTFATLTSASHCDNMELGCKIGAFCVGWTLFADTTVAVDRDVWMQCGSLVSGGAD